MLLEFMFGDVNKLIKTRQDKKIYFVNKGHRPKIQYTDMSYLTCMSCE